MSNIEQIKAEIGRRIELHDSLASNAESEMIANLEIGAAQALDDLRSFLSTLESEKPVQDGLEEEIKRYYDDWDGDCRYAQTARHFAQWGAEHLADARKTSSGSSEIPNDLEEAAKEYAREYTDSDNGNGGDDWEDDIKITFIAGAKWDREQMLKEAVEGEITKDNRGNNVIRVGLLNNGFEIGDKVRIIIVKENSHE